MVRIASATGVPCATRTSTWRSFATISSGLCLFLDMGPSSFGSYEPYLRADHFMGGGSIRKGRGGVLVDVFDLGRTLVSDYEHFTRAFTQIRASDIRSQVDGIYASGRFWPEPLLQLNP